MKNNILMALAFAFFQVFAAGQTTVDQYFKSLSLADLVNYPVSSQRLDGRSTFLAEGTILAYETNEHRRGKLLVRKNSHDLVIDWYTYDQDGRLYRSGQNVTVRGTYQYDLDKAENNAGGYDFWWRIADGQQRYFVPQNGAQFAVYQPSDGQFQPENDGNIYPYPLKKVKLSNGVEIAYAEEGKGDFTLLFIHGLGGYHQVWKKNIDEIRLSYRCIAIDLPGCGQSSKGNYSFSIRFYSDVIAELIAKLQLKNVVLVGHSLGGQVAMMTALKNLKEVKGIVLLAPSGLQVFTAQEKMGIDWLAQPEKIKNRSERQLKRAFEATYATGKIPDDAVFMLKYRLGLKNRPDDLDYFCQMTYRLSMAVVNEPVLDQLSQITVPTLILWGKEDAQIPPSLAKEAKQHIPNGEVQFISPCGHMVQWECAAEVNPFILRFVQSMAKK